jgi:hypothetical protein
LLSVLGLLVACGGETTETGTDSGNTNWLKECSTDLDCGALSCYCGTCRETCDGLVDCSANPEQACVAGSNPAEPPSTSVDVSVSPLLLDGDADVTDIARGPESSVYLTGGKGKYIADLANAYSDFWLAQIDSADEIAWEVREPIDEYESVGLSVAYRDGVVTTLITRFVEDDRTRLRTFSEQGEPISDEALTPEFAVARTHPTPEGTFLGGYGGERALVTSVGDLGGDWPAAFSGVEGSHSSVTDLAVASDGSLSVVGYMGTDPASNESVPWASRIAPNDPGVWDLRFPVSDRSHCEARGVALTRHGVTLVAGECAGNWLKGIATDGTVLWERRFAERVSAVAATATNYFVSTGSGTPGIDSKATLLAFDEQHRLLWRVGEAGCEAFHRLLPMDGAVVAVARCDGGIGLWKYRPEFDADRCSCDGGPVPLECGCTEDDCADTTEEVLQRLQCSGMPSTPTIGTGCGFRSISISRGLGAQTYHYDAITEQLVGFGTINDTSPSECTYGELPDCPDAVTCTPCQELATDDLPYCD